jgi:hypothetical protein
MNSPSILDLLTIIHRYYPIGMPSYCEEYAGIKQITAIVHKKIIEIQENIQTPWKLLMDELTTTYGRYHLSNYDFLQFRAYRAELNLEVKVSNQVAIRKSLIINVSMLTNVYTFFVLDEIEKETRSYPNSAALNIVCYDAETSLEGKTMIDNIRTTLEKYFTGYHFVGHNILMKQVIHAGITYGGFEENKNGHSLYQLLFDGNFTPERIRD